MARYIDANRLALLITECLKLPIKNKDYCAGLQTALQMLNDSPTADVKEVRRGEK